MTNKIHRYKRNNTKLKVKIIRVKLKVKTKNTTQKNIQMLKVKELQK